MGTNPWTYIFVFVFAIAGGTLILGVLYSLIIAKAAARYSDKVLDKFTVNMAKMLPGADCGQCGFKSCEEYADAVLHTEADEDKCPYAAAGTPEKMLAMREKLQKLMEDPTPPEDRKPRFWDKKFGGKP
jgi:Na+-translocating ferredoxin:NAD+ oxidoreductase RNF subunit RnfB